MTTAMRTGYDPWKIRENKWEISKKRSPVPEVPHADARVLLMPGELGAHNEVQEFLELNPQIDSSKLVLVEFDRAIPLGVYGNGVEVIYSDVARVLAGWRDTPFFSMHLDFCATAVNTSVLGSARNLTKTLAPTGAVVRLTMIKRKDHHEYYAKRGNPMPYERGKDQEYYDRDGEGRVFLKALRQLKHLTKDEYRQLKNQVVDVDFNSNFQTMRIVYELFRGSRTLRSASRNGEGSALEIVNCDVDLYSDADDAKNHGVNMETVRFVFKPTDNPRSVADSLLTVNNAINNHTFYSRVKENT